jgi:hypothetical protein
MTTRLFTIFMLAFILSNLLVTTAWAEDCETIRFQRGHSSAVVEGVAPPDTRYVIKLRPLPDKRPISRFQASIWYFPWKA